MLRQFLLPVRASVFIHKPSRAVLARGTFESIVVTNNCANTLYHRTAVELLPDGNMWCPSRIEECARVHSPDGLLPCYSLSLRSNSMHGTVVLGHNLSFREIPHFYYQQQGYGQNNPFDQRALTAQTATTAAHGVSVTEIKTP